MPAQALAPVHKATLNPRGLRGYAQLLKDVRKTLLHGQQKIEEQKVLTYWQTGRHIHRYVLDHKERAEYGKEIVLKLSRDLEVGDELLYRCLRFAERFPSISSARRKLSWTHYRELLAVPDQKERIKLAEEAARREWTTDQLIARIRKEFPASNGKEGPREITAFKPKRGIVSAYRVVMADVLLLDLGFSNFMEHPALTSGRFKEGNIVSVQTRPARASVIASPAKSALWRTKRGEAISILKNATPNDLYTYQAEVEKVVDADTLWLWIHIGFDIWMRQKVRLRGIDAPELNTNAGLRAKRFVESQLESAGPSWPVTVTTTKPDKYDRYLTDVWIGDTNLNQLLLSSGHARLIRQVSGDLWNESNWGRF